MPVTDVPVIVSNIRGVFGERVLITKHKTVNVSAANTECTVATKDRVYVRFKSPIACNPRSQKQRSTLVMKTDDVDGVLSSVPADYDVRKWTSKPFESWGYDCKMYFSPASVGILFIAYTDGFLALELPTLSSVEFMRTMPGTRSFDVVFYTKFGAKHVVENIDKSELSRLNAELESVGLAEHCSDGSDSCGSESCSEWSEGCSSSDEEFNDELCSDDSV